MRPVSLFMGEFTNQTFPSFQKKNKTKSLGGGGKKLHRPDPGLGGGRRTGKLFTARGRESGNSPPCGHGERTKAVVFDRVEKARRRKKEREKGKKKGEVALAF